MSRARRRTPPAGTRTTPSRGRTRSCSRASSPSSSLTYSAEHKVDTVSAQERPALTIDVVASKWEWTFSYAAYGITERSGFVGHQPLVVPTGEAIRFQLNSLDVMHSFWVPALRFKRAAIPGRAQNITLAFARLRVYPAQCAEFCGLRDAEMIFTVDGVTARRFAAWAAGGGGGPIS